MTYERPSPGNPHQIAVEQHIFPARSIKRFYSEDNMVQLLSLESGKLFKTPARNPIFCAMRAWHHGAESGFMLEIEDKFQRVASAIVSDRLRYITPFERDAVARFYALWMCRYRWQKAAARPDPVLKMGRPARDLTIEAQERLERAGVIYIRPDCTVPVRQLVGVKVHGEVDDLADRLRGLDWGIVRAGEGEFIVPDTYGELPALPISPGVILVLGEENATLGQADVASVNRHALAGAGRYVFARDLSTISPATRQHSLPSYPRKTTIRLPGPFWSSADRRAA